jgi:hypothetical protein
MLSEQDSDLADKLLPLDKVEGILMANIVEDNGREHLEVYPVRTLTPKQARRFNTRLLRAVAGKLPVSTVIPNGKEV